MIYFNSNLLSIFLFLITLMKAKAATSSLRKIIESKLGRSEPNPAWFGNDDNESSNPAWTNPNWLLSRFHFSFAEYSNPHNVGFGVMRVMNDDLVQPNRGFGAHGHRSVEICTYIVEGLLTHQDSLGTKESLGRGAVQFMSAGRGVQHSEHNLEEDKALRFIQIWIDTQQPNAKPRYGSFAGDEEARLNKWAHLVSGENSDVSTPIKIFQDANIYVAELTTSCDAIENASTIPLIQGLQYELKEGRQAYFLCMEGDVSITGTHGDEVLNRHDAAEIYGPNTFTTTPVASGSSQKAHVLMVEMEYTGRGRTDI